MFLALSLLSLLLLCFGLVVACSVLLLSSVVFVSFYFVSVVFFVLFWLLLLKNKLAFRMAMLRCFVGPVGFADLRLWRPKFRWAAPEVLSVTEEAQKALEVVRNRHDPKGSLTMIS